MKALLTTITLILLTFSINAAEHLVTIENFAFSPAKLDVAQGDLIIFTNRDGAPHNVVPRSESLVQFESSPILATGDSFTLEITEAEDILAHCGVHPRMPGIEINVISDRQLLLNNIRTQLDQLDQMVD